MRPRTLIAGVVGFALAFVAVVFAVGAMGAVAEAQHQRQYRHPATSNGRGRR